MESKTRSYCREFRTENVDPYVKTVELRLFQDNIYLILKHQLAIMSCSDYFFCRPSFSHCSIGALGATVLAGPIRLGQLVIGWRHGSLIEQCPRCEGKVLITKFGSLLNSGRNWWTGLCLECQQWVGSFSSQQDKFQRRLKTASRILKRLPDQFVQCEHYAAYAFSWSGDGLQPVSKSRMVRKWLYNPVPFDVLIEDLRSGCLRQGKPPIVATSQGQFERKFKLILALAVAPHLASMVRMDKIAQLYQNGAIVSESELNQQSPHNPLLDDPSKPGECAEEIEDLPAEEQPYIPQGLHEHFWSIGPKLPTDFEPYGQRSRCPEGGEIRLDCSCECKHFQPLQAMPRDWGVCANPKSPRCGLLTFEHQGCPEYEQGEPLEDK